MNPRELVDLVRPRRPPAPYGVQRLARAHSIGDLARLAQRRLPAAAFAYLEGGGEDEHTLRRNRAAFDAIELVPRVLRLSPDDARHAAGLGVDAVIVSNHGGRQLDHTPAAIDALPGIADAVGDHVEVLMDSGIRRGTDILTAIALGARAVLIGRAYLYGLATAGTPGVAHAVDILADELRTAMALTGASSLDDLDRSLLVESRTARWRGVE